MFDEDGAVKGHLVVVQENNLWTFMRHRSADSVREGLLLYRREGVTSLAAGRRIR